MCGISGFIGKYAISKVMDITINQIDRGVSSTGIAYIYNNSIRIVKDTVNPIEFSKRYGSLRFLDVDIAIGHNRAPSRGLISYENAHPFLSCNGSFALVHNGTVFFRDNYNRIKNLLIEHGHKVKGETDSELITHILEVYKNRIGDWVNAIEEWSRDWLSGAVLILTHEGKIYGVRNNDNPLVVVKSGGNIYLASELEAILPLIDEYEYALTPSDYVVVEVSKNNVIFYGDFKKARLEESYHRYWYKRFYKRWYR